MLRGYSGGNMPPNSTGVQDLYNRYSSGQQPAGYSTATPPSARNSSYPPGPQGHPPNTQQPSTSQPSPPSQSPAAPNYSGSQDYYRQEQVRFFFFLEKLMNWKSSSFSVIMKIEY